MMTSHKIGGRPEPLITHFSKAIRVNGKSNSVNVIFLGPHAIGFGSIFIQFVKGVTKVSEIIFDKRIV